MASVQPPEYSCTTSPPCYSNTFDEAIHVLLKPELASPTTQWPDRQWRRVILQLQGTQILLQQSTDLLVCQRPLSLQGAQAGLAIDYYKKSFVFRIRVEGYQFLCATGSFAAAIGWVDALNAAIAVSADLDERKEPIYQTMASIRTPGTRNIKTKMSGTTTFRQMLNWRKYNVNGAWLRDQEGEHSRMGLKRYLEDEEQLLADHSAAVQQTFAAHCFRSACFGSAKTAVSPDSNHSASTRMQCGPDNVAALDAKKMADYNAWQDSRIELAWKRLEYARRCAKTLTLRDSWVDNRYLRGRAWVVMPPKKRSPTPALPGWPGLM